MSSEADIWRSAWREVENSRRVVMCTVIQGRGSVPRELGARMLVGEMGVIAGTVGGGCGEAEVLVGARKAIAGAEFPLIVEVDLSGSLEQKEIQACGGWMRVALRVLSPEDENWLSQCASAEKHSRSGVLVEQLGSDQVVLLHEGESTEGVPEEVLQALPRAGGRRFEITGREWFAQRIGTSEHLIIVGSGHVAQPLCEFAAKSGFRVTIVDDRPSYVTKARFPDASEHLIGGHAKLLGERELNERTYVVIITRGHQHDMASLRAALESSPAYVGMIGSRRRAVETLRALRDEGFNEEALARVFSPIGLDIGALTPAEIAIAILAEVIGARRGGKGSPLAMARPEI